jgi:hypothetical protein
VDLVAFLRAEVVEGRGGHRTLESKQWAFSEEGALKEGTTIVFCDEWGFYVLAMVVGSYAPVAKTPLLKENLTPDHLLRA